MALRAALEILCLRLCSNNLKTYFPTVSVEPSNKNESHTLESTSFSFDDESPVESSGSEPILKWLKFSSDELELDELKLDELNFLNKQNDKNECDCYLGELEWLDSTFM